MRRDRARLGAVWVEGAGRVLEGADIGIVWVLQAAQCAAVSNGGWGGTGQGWGRQGWKVQAKRWRVQA